MVLDQLTDGASRHLSVPDTFENSEVRKLVFILCLPLLDGVFATLLVSGAIATFSDVVSVGLTIFAGAGALAVMFSSEMDSRKMIDAAAPVLLLGALLVALIAPVYEQLFYIQNMKIAAALALLVIALQMLEIDLAEKFSVPAIILTGLALSIRNPGALVVTPEYVLPALLTSSAAVVVLYLSTMIDQEYLDLNYLQKGSSLVLLAMALSMLGVEIPGDLSLTLLTLTFVVSLRSQNSNV